MSNRLRHVEYVPLLDIQLICALHFKTSLKSKLMQLEDFRDNHSESMILSPIPTIRGGETIQTSVMLRGPNFRIFRLNHLNNSHLLQIQVCLLKKLLRIL